MGSLVKCGSSQSHKITTFRDSGGCASLFMIVIKRVALKFTNTTMSDNNNQAPDSTRLSTDRSSERLQDLTSSHYPSPPPTASSDHSTPTSHSTLPAAVVQRQLRWTTKQEKTIWVDTQLETVHAQLGFDSKRKHTGSKALTMMNTRFIRQALDPSKQQQVWLIEEYCRQTDVGLQDTVTLGKRKHTDELSMEDATKCAQMLHKLIKGKVDLAPEVRAA